MNYKKEEIVNYIIEIFQESFFITIEKTNENITTNLFDVKIGLKSIDMVYLVKLLENKFNIVFNEKHFDRKSFYTIEGISDVIVNSYR